MYNSKRKKERKKERKEERKTLGCTIYKLV
jgi:hypothetical protein